MTAVDYDDEAAEGPWLRLPPGVTTLASVEPERVAWLWPGRLPLGKLVVLDGDPSLGKSTLALDLAARVSTGSPMPDGHRLDGPRDVVLLSAEDGLADTIRPRLDAAGADPARVHALVDVPTFTEDGAAAGTRPPTLPGDVDLLELVVQRTGAALVVIDVLSAYLGAGIDAYRDQDVRRALHQLAALAERTGSVVVCIRHLSKTGGANPLYRGGGSIGIIGAARCGLLVALDPDDEAGARRILAVTKSNLSEVAPALAYRLLPDDERGCARLAWEGATTHRAADLLATPDDEDRTARDEAADFLIDLLSAGPVPANAVKKKATEAGIAERTLKRAKKKVGAESYREGFGPSATWWWRIEEGHADSIEDEGGRPESAAPYDPLWDNGGPLPEDGD